MAALLAATGVFALSSQVVTERTRDFGIRTALGASVADIVRHVLRSILVPCAVGVVLGLARLVQAMAVRPWWRDPD
jgi:ABC-type antimicrobial peptide transport system permease subunit